MYTQYQQTFIYYTPFLANLAHSNALHLKKEFPLPLIFSVPARYLIPSPSTPPWKNSGIFHLESIHHLLPYHTPAHVGTYVDNIPLLVPTLWLYLPQYPPHLLSFLPFIHLKQRNGLF